MPKGEYRLLGVGDKNREQASTDEAGSFLDGDGPSKRGTRRHGFWKQLGERLHRAHGHTDGPTTVGAVENPNIPFATSLLGVRLEKVASEIVGQGSLRNRPGRLLIDLGSLNLDDLPGLQNKGR